MLIRGKQAGNQAYKGVRLPAEIFRLSQGELNNKASRRQKDGLFSN